MFSSPLKSKVAAIFIVPFAVAHMLLTLLYIGHLHNDAKRGTLQRLGTIATMLGSRWVDMVPDVQAEFARYAAQFELERVWLMGEDNLIRASSAPAEAGMTPGAPWRDAVASAVAASAQREMAPVEANGYWVVAHPVPGSGRHVVLLKAQASVSAALTEMALTVALYSLLIWLVLAGALLVFLQKVIVQPVERLSLVAQRIVQGESVTPEQRTDLIGNSRAASGLADAFLDLSANLFGARNIMREAEARFQTLFELAPEMIVVCSLETGEILEANRAFCNALGLAEDQVRGRNAASLEAHVPFALLQELAERSRAEQKSFTNIEYELFGSAQEPVPALVSLCALQYGGQWAYMVVAADMAEQKALVKQLTGYMDSLEELVEERTAALKQSEKFLDQVVDSARIVIAAFDGADRMVKWNRQAAVLTGYQQHELPGLDEMLRALLPTAEARKRFKNWITSGVDRVHESVVVSHTGERRQVAWTCQEVRGDAAAVGTRVLVGVDVTAERTLQRTIHKHSKHLEQLVAQRTYELRQRNEALSRINHELDDFTRIVSHDLQAPLRSIHGFANLIDESSADRLDEEGRLYLEMIQQAAKRMSNLIDSLLRLSRGGRVHEAHTEVDMNALTLEVIEQHSAYSLTGVRTPEIIVQPNLPGAYGDRLRLIQVFENLITNALKYNKSEQPVVRIGGRYEEDGTLFWVKDNGIGIPQERQEKIFNMFYRAHPEEDIPGSGAGLAICKKIVEAHQGRLWVESEQGKGSTFFVFLPGDASRPEQADEMAMPKTGYNKIQ